ncbi:Pr6Pr family membrane protein [Lentzea sp. BCCO 10_0798]|uniref:Pr6Pr family membrane protein n=1 Tax=Lentzea kristufekii TaxID=3095430 RepID=A0ABU4U303_9PSEU|nr:Pr6Pr family membrane protein [Lentzea sp. BCCO 10_0798]MDX8054780.1 Pr6Pr family membrane protein [Lentzea sp. BCCO 10_0798]
MIKLLRMAVFLLVLSAEIYLVVVLGDNFRAFNHFSYFTVLSNVFAAVVALLGVFSPVSAQIRGAAVLYMGTTGIVYWLLLRGIDVQTPAYANWVLHTVVPILVVVEWLLAPEKTRRWWIWLSFPLAYLVYTLVRGPIVDWYPYPFMDPRQNGYGAVLLTCLFVAVVFGVLALAVSWAGNKLAQKRSMSLSYD